MKKLNLIILIVGFVLFVGILIMGNNLMKTKRQITELQLENQVKIEEEQIKVKDNIIYLMENAKDIWTVLDRMSVDYPPKYLWK